MPDTADEFEVLLERVKRLTGLGAREAAQVAFDLADSTPTAREIVAKAKELGYDVEDPGEDARQADRKQSAMGVGITMSPTEVLTEVYMMCPRVLSQKVPRLGKAPEQFSALIEEALGELPDDVRAMVAKIDIFDGGATFWLRDEANEVDRPIGPISLKPYVEGDVDENDPFEVAHAHVNALYRAFEALIPRLGRVLAADSN